jgi:PAS domain-containing protein
MEANVAITDQKAAEHPGETVKSGFCQTDLQGRIVLANRGMEWLAEEKTLVGKRLADYFNDEDRKVVQDLLSVPDHLGPGIVCLTMVSIRGGRAVVNAEIGPLIVDDLHIGGYAHITDVSLAEKHQQQAYDRALLGIARLNREGELLFANRSLLQLLNMQDYRGICVFDLLPDEASRKLVRRQLDSRFAWQSDEYTVDLLRSGDNEKIPVMISAFPETDLSGRRVARSLAIVQSMMAPKMRYIVESHRDEKELLKAVLNKLSLVVPFDLATVSRYSLDRQFARSIYSSNSHDGRAWQRRWWKLTPARIRWSSQEEIRIVEDIEQFLERPDWVDLKQEPDVRKLIDEGYKSLIRYPVFRNGALAASVTLISRSPRFYNEHHKRRLLNLPIKTAVHKALDCHKIAESKFTSDLIMNLSNSGNDLDAVAHNLVEAVAAHFQCQSVSLFKVNQKAGLIRLIDQAAIRPEYMIDKGYKRKINDGVLGEVIQNGKIVNIGDVTKDEKFKQKYRSISDSVQMHSELCIPIPFGGTLWLLNIEDEQIDAFSLEEQNELRRVMDEVGYYLEKTWLSHFLEASLKSSSDAVLVTDSDGRVIQVNPAATEMLPIDLRPERSRHAAGALERRALMHISPLPLQSIFENPEEARRAIEADYKPAGAIRLKRRPEGALFATLTRIDLQADFGRTIYFVSDITAQQRLKQIENLENVYHELAVQTKTPLSLALGWINRLKRRQTDPDLMDTLEKSLRQLKKLEITYNRLALYAAEQEALPFNPTLFDIAELIDSVKTDLPEGEQSKIAWSHCPAQGLIRGDIFQLRFCLETILAYLLRFATNEYKIDLAVSGEENDCVIAITGWTPRPEYPLGDTTRRLETDACTEADIFLGRQLVDRIVARHRGTFTVSRKGAGIKIFRLSLKTWEGGRHEA